jgi:hypothetical protein
MYHQKQFYIDSGKPGRYGNVNPLKILFQQYLCDNAFEQGTM